jgi:nitrous oxide reductase accessory protein NosL
MLKRLFAAVAVACLLAGCQTSLTGWGQIAVGVGQVIGPTKSDAKVAKASEQLGKYCGALQTVAFGATLFAPEKQRNIAAMASAAVNTVCAAPPADVAAALVTAAKTYEAIEAARRTPDTL